MRLTFKLVDRWPKLAWVAVSSGGDHVTVCHGPMVEVHEGWLAEAVWAGPLEEGGFDQTDLVFGTGIRLRGETAVFVTSGTVFDRLLYCCRGGSWYFSNSLPALLATAGLKLQDDYPRYTEDVQSIVGGLANRARTIPTDAEDVVSVFYNNVIFDGCRVLEQPKPDAAPRFRTFGDYYDFLAAAATRLGENAASPDRRHRVIPLSSISSGYDSSVGAAISRLAGCERTVSIKDSTSWWRGSDSGIHIANKLGMSCIEYPRKSHSYPLEESVWAGSGRPGILNWTLFDYPEPLCLFFTGCHGEKLWDRVDHDHPDPFVRRDTASLGFCEYRLIKGVFQCVVPFWAVRHSRELKAITLSEEMRPWYTGRDYDKPIARRILDQAGVPGEAFGRRKKNCSHEASFLWPYSPEARERFAAFLRNRGHGVPGRPALGLIRRAAHAENLLHMNLLGRIGLRKRFRPWQRVRGCSLVFQWANEELRRRYLEGLREVSREMPAASGATRQ